MSKNQSNRERKRRRQREALARRRAPSRPNPPTGDARFHCDTCGTTFAQPGVLVADFAFTEVETGVTTHIDMSQTEMVATCPVCHQGASPVNMHVVESGGHWGVGFADTPEQLAAIAAALDELRQLDDEASFDEIVRVLEDQGPEVRPVVEYLRRHHLELAALGLNLLAVVIALLTWLVPTGAADPQEAPAGITRDQMERLVRDLEREAAPADRREPTGRAHEGEQQRDQGPTRSTGSHQQSTE